MHPSRLLLAASLAIAAPLLASIDLPRENERWTRLELDDYVIYSAVRDNVTRDVAQRLQLMRDGLAVMTHLNVHPPRRVTVLLFPNDRAFAPYRDAALGKKMTHVNALFGGTIEDAYILIDTDSNRGLDRSVYHELTHCFTRNTAGELPLWFTEGIAEFYSTFQTYGRDKLRIGAPVSEHLLWLRERGLIPLTRLFAVDFDSPDYSEQYHAGDFYAESWLLVHYLMLGNEERGKRLGAFLTLLVNKEPPASACEKAFGIKLVQLENELHRYLDQPTMHVGDFTPAEKHVYTISDPVPAARDAILLSLGSFLARTTAGMTEAPAFFDAALVANPNNGDVYSAIAELAQRRGDTAERDAAVTKAVALGTTDANAYIGAANLLINRDVDKARALYEKALALNPKAKEVRNALADIDAQMARSKAIDEVNRAITMANKGQINEALAVLDSVMPTIADPDLQSKTKSLRAQLAGAAKPGKR